MSPSAPSPHLPNNRIVCTHLRQHYLFALPHPSLVLKSVRAICKMAEAVAKRQQRHRGRSSHRALPLSTGSHSLLTPNNESYE